MGTVETSAIWHYRALHSALMAYPKVAQFRSVDSFRERLRALNLELPVDDGPLCAADSPLAAPVRIGPYTVGNRWCIHPMEGWDATLEGQPTENTFRRWRHFGQSGAKLIWGGEAAAVRHDGRANPNQLFYRPENESGLRALLEALRAAHRNRFGSANDLLVGLQLTHSGRFSRPHPDGRPAPRIAYHHPLLDRQHKISPTDDTPILTDAEIPPLIDSYVAAARAAQRIGFHFVDIKACHGYLVHEFLSAFDRPGPYGGDFDGRTRLLRDTIAAVRAACPGLLIGVRLSAFDHPPFAAGPDGVGVAADFASCLPYPAFGCRRDDPTQIDLPEPIRLLQMLHSEGVWLVNLSAGSPYYCPHVSRPAYYPPSDGYPPPEDPLVGCVRQIHAVRDLKAAVPDVPMVGTAYTYFQEYLPHVAQAVVRAGWTDFVGLGRMVLSYPGLPADTLAYGSLPPASTQKICRTFSDCTTAPRNGLPSGCYPLDEHYKRSAVAATLQEIKRQQRNRAS